MITEMKKIKQITIYRKSIDGSAADDDKGILMSKEVFHPDFDKPVLQEQYGVDGNLEQSTEFEYDDKGFLIRQTLKEADGMVTEEKSFEPDENRHIAREYLHYADGSRDTINYSYDEDGNVVRKETVDADGDVEEIAEMAYQDGQLVHHLVKDSDGEIIEEHRFVYEGDLPLEVFHFDEMAGSGQKRVYSYDDAGNRESVLVYDDSDNLVERVLFENDDQGRPVMIVEENRKKKNTIKLQYEKHGNVGFQEEFDLKGNLVSRIARTYSDDGLLLESKIEAVIPAMGTTQSYVVRQEYDFY